MTPTYETQILQSGREPEATPQALHPYRDSLCYVEVTTGRCCVEGRPALVVLLVYTGSVLHQKLHHVQIFINTSLERKGHPFTQQALTECYTVPDTALGTDNAAALMKYWFPFPASWCKCPECDFSALWSYANPWILSMPQYLSCETGIMIFNLIYSAVRVKRGKRLLKYYKWVSSFIIIKKRGNVRNH